MTKFFLCQVEFGDDTRLSRGVDAHRLRQYIQGRLELMFIQVTEGPQPAVKVLEPVEPVDLDKFKE